MGDLIDELIEFDDLPVEIRVVVFSFLNCRELAQVSRVSKEWRAIVYSSQEIWGSELIEIKPKSAVVPKPRVCHGSLMCKSKMIIFGGHAASQSDFITEVFPDVWSFDFETRSWEVFPNVSIQRTETQPIFYGDSIYVFGGFTLQTAPRLNSLVKMNINNGEVHVLETHGQVPSVRSGHSCTQWGKYLIVYGGWDAVVSKNDMYRLDLDSLTWEREDFHETSIPAPGLRSHSCVVFQNFMYIFGGTTATSSFNADLFRYNLESRMWEIVNTSGEKPCARTRVKATIFEDKMYVVGGVASTFLNDFLYELDLTTLRWKKLKPSSPDLSAISQTEPVMYKDVLVFFGGSKPLQNISDMMFAMKVGSTNRVMSTS